MTIRNQNATSVRLNADELARLLEVLTNEIGLDSNWTHATEQQISTLLRGFDAIGDIEPAAAIWSTHLRALLVEKPAFESENSGITPLCVLLQSQPAHFPHTQVKQCLGLVARTVAAKVSGLHVSDSFVNGLGQLFLSKKQHWSIARETLTRLQSSDEQTDLDQLPEVARQFLKSARQMNRANVTFPNLMSQLPNAVDSGRTEAVGKRMTSKQALNDQEIRVEREFTSNQCDHLFELQIAQQGYEPPLNHYRLANDWGVPTLLEFEECCGLLVHDLLGRAQEHDSIKMQVHAAARLLSMIATISIENLAAVPLKRCGSMHLDLPCGILRRDVRCISPRTDRTRGARWKGRWFRTPVPPQVLQVLRDAHARCPSAECLGDLLKEVGLTPSTCHKLLNRERTEGRAFESLRVARSLRGYLLSAGVHASVVSRTLGDVVIVPRSHHYYLALEQIEVHKAIDLWCRHIGLETTKPLCSASVIGSPKAISLERMRRTFLQIQAANHKDRMHVTARSTIETVVEFHNNYSTRFGQQTFFGIGARCQNLSSMTVASLYADENAIAVSDRKSDRYAQIRICPLTTPQKWTRLHYLEHLHAMQAWLTRSGYLEVASELRKITSGEHIDTHPVPILVWTTTGKLTVRCLSRTDLTKASKELSLSDLNVPRHFLVTELVRRKVSPAAIDALIGHHQTGAPTFGVGGGVSIQDFLDYMSLVLEDIHKDLGIQPLIGLGRTDKKRLALPRLELPADMPEISNQYLKQRLQAEDFNPPDRYFTEEDCPVCDLSLAARMNMRKLQRKFAASDLSKQHPAGAAVFCLVAFDSVLNVKDVLAYLDRLSSQSESSIGSLTVVEIFSEEPLPSAQCLLSGFTQDALTIVRRMKAKLEGNSSIKDFHALISKLDKAWGAFRPFPALRRLQILASHVLLLDIAPVARFSFFHKSPFIPFQDLKRICDETPVQFEQVKFATQYKPRPEEFELQLRALKKWSDKDSELGEHRRRAAGLKNELLAMEVTYAFDDADLYLNAFLLAELSGSPPFRRLSIPVVLSYLRIQVHFFSFVRNIGGLPRTESEWKEAQKIFRTDSGRSASKYKWAGMHVAAWMQKQGYVVPHVLRTGDARASNFRPHLSAYITTLETETCGAILRSSSEDAHIGEWNEALLLTSRKCALRPQETRYMKAAHISADASTIYVTTSGHMHMKTEHSRGVLKVPLDLQLLLTTHKHRRIHSPDGKDSSAFSGARNDGFKEFDSRAKASLDLIKKVTARDDLRWYDFRANAITDLIYDVHRGAKALASEHMTQVSKLSANEFEDRFKRGAVAAREARQTTVVTTLRYYCLSGPLEAREAMDFQQRLVKRSSRYLSVVTNTTPAAVLAERYRSQKRTRLGGYINKKVPHKKDMRSFEKPGVDIEARDESHSPATRSLVLGGLLLLAGMPAQAAADTCKLALDKLLASESHLRSCSEKAGIKSLPPLFACASSSWYELVLSAASWASILKTELSIHTRNSPAAFRFHGSHVIFRNQASLDAALHLFVGLKSLGIQPVAVFSRELLPSCRAALSTQLTEQGVLCSSAVARRHAFVALLFLPAASFPDATQPSAVKFSNHTSGKLGRMVVAAMSLAISTT